MILMKARFFYKKFRYNEFTIVILNTYSSNTDPIYPLELMLLLQKIKVFFVILK